jgi:hypothetical protein
MSTHPELINPPADVQTAVAAVVKACGDWQPTQVETRPPLAPQAAAPSLSEAQVCGFIQHPYAQVWDAMGVALMLALFLIVVVWGLSLHRLPGAIWRLARRTAYAAAARFGGAA